MKLIVIGGAGRSGTSFTYRQLLNCPSVCGYRDFESGLFCSNNSIIDLYHRYTDSYTPDRYAYSSSMFKSLAVEKFLKYSSKSELRSILDSFFKALHGNRFNTDIRDKVFKQEARTLLCKLFDYDINEHNILLEKTPHNALIFSQIKQLESSAKLIHMVRDPRAIAESVVRQSWGPSIFKDAVMWVKAILTHWIKNKINRDGIKSDILVLRIEDFIAHSGHYESLLREYLSDPLNGLSLQANSTTLDKWTINLSDSDIKFATTQLMDIILHFGYEPKSYNSNDQITQYPAVYN